MGESRDAEHNAARCACCQVGYVYSLRTRGYNVKFSSLLENPNPKGLENIAAATPMGLAMLELESNTKWSAMEDAWKGVDTEWVRKVES